jgi:hypothetical protein
MIAMAILSALLSIPFILYVLAYDMFDVNTYLKFFGTALGRGILILIVLACQLLDTTLGMIALLAVALLIVMLDKDKEHFSLSQPHPWHEAKEKMWRTGNSQPVSMPF